MSHEESELQQAMVTLYRRCAAPGRSVLFSVPNGADLAGNPGILIGEGLLEGVSDLVLLVPARSGIPGAPGEAWLPEVKLPKRTTWGPGGVVVKPQTRQSESQKAFEAGVAALGFQYRVIRSLEDFVAFCDEAGVVWRSRPILAPASRQPEHDVSRDAQQQA